MVDIDITQTFGALLVGALLATALSGIVVVQCFLYFRTFRSDPPRTKLLVSVILVVDTCHSVFIWASVWDYLIVHFGDASRRDFIPTTIALTIALTAILTFCVYCFFCHRIFKLSQRNWYITVPVLVLSFLRLCAATVTTTEMIRLRSYVLFTQSYAWIFTIGLALSSVIDVFIAASLCYFLRHSRTGHSSLDHVLDKLMLYTLETGLLTCAATVVAMLCWLTMPDNLIFLGFHFVICKLYSNSLLATLNTRKHLQRSPNSSPEERGGRLNRIDLQSTQDCYAYRMDWQKTSKLEINVEKEINYDGDNHGRHMRAPSSSDDSTVSEPMSA
ncbi:hypothetical protein PLICRDRAFT_121529 [Plicaturopsis crispa FD-325 SS-3]|nr:hypothetical protein PLICRDRAFT_121529 [Plicaturopsis crispa FD-325 SS-3]